LGNELLKGHLWGIDSGQNFSMVDRKRSKEIIRIETKYGATETPLPHGNDCGFVKCVQCAIDLEGFFFKFLLFVPFCTRS
jgi:hypothetical protein